MRVIVAGSRGIDDYRVVKKAIEDSGFEVTTIISGCARGVDTLGELYAERNNIPVELFPARWDRFGRKAGIIRNRQMAKNADALVAVWDGFSDGTRAMIAIAYQEGLKVFVYQL